jgi:hypothetical protein
MLELSDSLKDDFATKLILGKLFSNLIRNTFKSRNLNSKRV